MTPRDTKRETPTTLLASNATLRRNLGTTRRRSRTVFFGVKLRRFSSLRLQREERTVGYWIRGKPKK